MDVQFHDAGGLLICDFTINFCARRLLSAFKSGSWIAEIFCVPYLQILWTGDWNEIYGASGYWAAYYWSIFNLLLGMIGRHQRAGCTQSGPEECSQCFCISAKPSASFFKRRALQSACHWRGAASPSLLAKVGGWSVFWKSILSKLVLGAKQLCWNDWEIFLKVHQEPKLRLVIKETCQKLRGWRS